MPASLLVACLVMLSLAGMVFGTVLGARTDIEIKARRPGRSGSVQVQVRRMPAADLASVELWEGAHLRRVRPEIGEGPDPWDVLLVRALVPAEGSQWSVLVVGGGASGAPRAVLTGHPTATVHVLERTGAVVELGRDHFETELAIASGERCSVEVDNLDDAVGRLTHRYDLVLVDTAALAPLGGMTGLSRATRLKLVQVVVSEGVLAWGPLGLEPGITELPEGWARRVAHRRSAQPAHGPEVASDTMGLGDGSRFGELGPLQAGTSFDEEHVVLMARNEVLSRLPDVPGFLSSGPTAQRGDVPLAVGPDTPPQ